MAKSMTKSQLASELSERTGITKKTAAAVLDELAEISYKEAENSFTLPGVGKLVLIQRKARKGRNPATGQEIDIPAKKDVKFRVSKVCKDSILSKYKMFGLS